MTQNIESKRAYRVDKYSIIVTICFFLIASYVAFFHHNYWTFDVDGIYYLLAGQEILSGNEENVVMLHAPVGGSILFASLNLVFNDGFSVIKAISVLSATGMVFFSFYIIRNFFDTKTSLLGQLFFALNPWVFLFAIQARNEILPVFLVMAATFFITKKDIKLHDVIIIGCLVGAATEIRYQSAFILVAFVVFLLIRNKKIRTNLLYAALLILLFTVVASPAFLYNYFTHGTFLDEVDPSRYIADRSKFTTEEWKDDVFQQSQKGLSSGIFVDFDLWAKNYFYNLLYGVPNSLFGFENKVSASLIPAIPILGAIPVLGGLIYSLKITPSKKTLITILSTAAITTALVFLLGDFKDHFFAIVIIPLIVIGILNIKNIDRNFIPLLLMPIFFSLAISIIPVRGPHHFLFIWISFATLSAIFFTKMIPEMYKLRNSIKKRKFKINYSLRVILILLFVLFVLINITYSYIQLRVLSTDEPFIGIQDELKRIQENQPLEKVGIEIKEISDVLAKEPGIEDRFVGASLVYAAYLDSNRVFFSYIEGPDNDTIENYITRKNWSSYDIHYSNLHSWPLDRHDKYNNLPDYLIYPPSENYHDYLKKLENPNDSEVPSNFELIYKGSRGTMVYKISHIEGNDV